MSFNTMIEQHSTQGFYKASVSKALLGIVGVNHIAINVGMFSHLQKYLICKIPDSFLKGEWWRLLTSNISFLETKDAIFAMILIYQFRIFERRLGSRKFASHLLAMLTISGIIEWLITTSLVHFYPKFCNGLLATGPFGLVFPWFIFYFKDIPCLAPTHFLGIRITSKIINYLICVQVWSGSLPHGISVLSSLIAGFIVKSNFMWVQRLLVIPRFIAKSTQKIFGWLIDSSPPPQGAIGATLEIQRSQQMEALEQHLMRQQAQMNIRRMPNQAFRQRPAAAAPEPTEANITLLVDMGFPRQQAIEALREAHNDLSTATAILLRNT